MCTRGAGAGLGAALRNPTNPKNLSETRCFAVGVQTAEPPPHGSLWIDFRRRNLRTDEQI